MDTKERIAECGRRCEQQLVWAQGAREAGFEYSAVSHALSAQDESLFAFELAREL